MGGWMAGGVVSTSHTGLRIVQQLWASESQCCLPLSHSAFQSGRFEFARHYHRTPMPPAAPRPTVSAVCLPPAPLSLAQKMPEHEPQSNRLQVSRGSVTNEKHHMKIFPVKTDKICVHAAASEKFPNKQFGRLGEITR